MFRVFPNDKQRGYNNQIGKHWELLYDLMKLYRQGIYNCDLCGKIIIPNLRQYDN